MNASFWVFTPAGIGTARIMNTRNDFGHDDSTIKLSWLLLLLLFYKPTSTKPQAGKLG